MAVDTGALARGFEIRGRPLTLPRFRTILPEQPNSPIYKRSYTPCCRTADKILFVSLHKETTLYEVTNFLRNKLYINIFMFIVALIFFLSIPDIDILEILSEYKSLSAKMDNIGAASIILNKKQDELSYFVLLLKVIATILLYVAMFTVSYLFYAQDKAHKSIAHLTSRIDGISRSLQKHFEDYKVLLEYSRMPDSVIHHDFKEALQL